MKLSSTLFTTTCVVQAVHVASSGLRGESSAILSEDLVALDSRELQAGACFSGMDFSVMLNQPCNFVTLQETVASKIFTNNADPLGVFCSNTAAEEIVALLGVADEVAAEASVAGMCSTAMSNYDAANAVPWTDVTGHGLEFDKNYFDGRTFWNEEHQSDYPHVPFIAGEPSNVLNRDAEQVDDFFETSAQRKVLEWPGDAGIPNFEGCEIRAAMCCWVSDRQANDNNGNCRTPYDTNCVDADPGDNTDLCAVDLARSGGSNNVNDGIAVYPFNTEGPVHCHGLAWGLDAQDSATRFKGNNMFFVSMSDHMHDRGYVRNVPGAPMCSCLEKSPIVSRADCTEINLKEFYKFDFTAAGTASAAITYLDINFNSCRARRNNDLYEYYRRLRDEGRATQTDFYKFARIVAGNGQCTNAVQDLLFEKGHRFQAPQIDGWTQVYGKGMLASADIEPEKWETAPSTVPFYVRRQCLSCSRTSHQDIIYKRLTPIEEIDLPNLFLSNWFDDPPGNGRNYRGVDFNLFSSMEDALSDSNPWTFCNFDDAGIGFPRDCGPTGRVNSEWNSLHRGGETDYAYYVYTG